MGTENSSGPIKNKTSISSKHEKRLATCVRPPADTATADRDNDAAAGYP